MLLRNFQNFIKNMSRRVCQCNFTKKFSNVFSKINVLFSYQANIFERTSHAVLKSFAPISYPNVQTTQ